MHDALTARFTDADEIKDVAMYGCSGGVSGFIYYSENEKFFDKYEDEIYDYLNDCEMSMVNFVDSGSTISSLKNDMVWAVVEAWCYAQHTVNEMEAEALAAWLIMLYQVNYNRGYNTPICATEYTYADSFDEAWVKGDCMAQYPEQVCDVFPINNDVRK